MEVDNQNENRFDDAIGLSYNHRSSGGENDHGFVTTADDINRDVSDVWSSDIFAANESCLIFFLYYSWSWIQMVSILHSSYNIDHWLYV